MSDDDREVFSIPFLDALASVPHTRAIITRELRRMARAEGPYKRFTYMTSRIKNIWLAAADIVEEGRQP